MLVVAPAAPLEVRATSFDPLRGRLKNLGGLGTNKARLFFLDRGLDSFSRQGKRHEGGFSPPFVVGRQTRQSVSAVDELFNGEFQEMILCQRSLSVTKPAVRRSAKIRKRNMRDHAIGASGMNGEEGKIAHMFATAAPAGSRWHLLTTLVTL